MTKRKAKLQEDQRIRAEARKMLASPRFFNEFLAAVGKAGLVGEKKNALVLLIVVVSRLLRRPLSALVKGVSAAGKNWLVTRIFLLMPPGRVRELSSLSERAWNYLKNHFRHRVIYLQERSGEAGGSMHPMRLLISERKLVRLVTQWVNGQRVTKKYVANGPVAAISTTTRSGLEIDDETRHISVFVDESAEQTRRIVQAYTRQDQTLPKAELRIWHMVHRLIEERAAFEIVFPGWYDEVAATVFAEDVAVRRYFPAFVEGCRSVCLVRSFQRYPELPENGRITVDFADFAIALIGDSVISFEKAILIEGVDSKLAVHVISRPYKNEVGDQNVQLITFTLINRNESPKSSNDQLCFFQCRMEITPSHSEHCFLVYPDLRQTGDPEERSLRFLYRKRSVFGVGHGCSCDWQEDESGRCNSIWTEVLPMYEVRPIEHADLSGISFSMEKLAVEGPEAIDLCEKLVDAYRAWIGEQRNKLSDPLEVSPQFLDVAKANLQQCEECLARILRGIELLRNQPRVRKAFALANQAMYLQQAHYDLASNNVRSWLWKDRKLQLVEPYKRPDYSSKAAAWRPFQLAFLLMNLESIANTASKERNIVDLIWFPTGGGKTEAYLGLSAFSIVLRRLRNQHDGGTAVLMRYTLRLLTTQQFQRAASLICACEFLRRLSPEKLGECPISIGLWVGGGVTPNDHQEAVSALNRLYQSPNENRFIVLACPWCGAGMGPVKAGSSWKVTGYQKVSKPSRVLFRCEDPDCPFNTEAGLPLTVVDEAIYKEPPTLIIGTVDKFAMLTWRPEAKSLFGLSHNYSPPELIIQDELHLISGPLGSMVAHYETAIEALCRAADADNPPKIVASTATISRANDQIKALYNGRSGFLFPPQGLEVGDSFFAKENRSKPGRCYVGVFASALPSHVTAQIRVVSALLQSVKSIPVVRRQAFFPVNDN